MELNSAADKLISRLRRFFQLNNTKLTYLSEEPLRAELFSSEQMERFGKTLAHAHKLSKRTGKDQLLRRLAKNEIILNEVRKLLADSIKRKYQVTPAGEWLIDNFYLIEEHIRSAKVHFPKDYSEDLPQLLPDDGAPAQTRVYDIALQFISHSDGRIDGQHLGSFIRAYQTVTNLHLGELWAIPIMLRLALIENLRRVSAQIAIDRVDRNLADYWAKQMIETAEKDPKNLILVVADMARSNPPMVSAFVSELTRQLRGRGPDLALALNWIEQQLSETGLTSEELINAEIQKQAADQVSVSNSIGSLRLLSAFDWREFVEAHSVVEQTLQEDTGGIYCAMDFATRDRYRHVVEHIAKRSTCSEYDIARIAIKLAREQSNANDPRKSHVGYFLIGPGISQTRRQAKMRLSFRERFDIAAQKYTLFIYLLSITALTFSLTAVIDWLAYAETKDLPLLIVITILTLLSTSQLAKSVVDFICTLLARPHLLPRMDFAHVIPSNARTMIVIPVMLTSREDIDVLVESLEVRFLANRNEHLHFALLTDFADAKQEMLPGDNELLDAVQEQIAQLNKKYHHEKLDLFYLFHRPRRWNPKEKVWMGYERKRGKLSELNDLLRGKGRERFSIALGDPSIFPSIKYVITLDADTQLPLGAAWKLIGTMAHPMNVPYYDPRKKRVTKGYGILQPRVTVSLPGNNSSPYAIMHGNEPGIDPYTRASSDVYQDLFGEGSFIGKGIYDVDIFRQTLEGRFAENCILSHDLLEGCYVRSGLVSDVHLFEKYPTTYRADMKRRERWVRGDWQIFSWFLPLVRDAKRHWHKNPLSVLSRWKIFDNLRRSLVPLALVIFLIIAWFAFSASLTWSTIVTCIILVPVVVTTLWDTMRKPKDVILTHHIKNSVRNIGSVAWKTLFQLICLPFEAFSNLHAIARTAWRVLVTRRKLLQWNPSAIEEKRSGVDLYHAYSFMWFEPFLALTVLTILLSLQPEKLGIAGPILALWLAAPLVTWFMSQPLQKKAAALSEAQKLFLRKAARKTWSFFERFVVEEDNWLPPDNFQEQPVAKVAHRTSVTNIGLSLLSTISAHEFGYITTTQLIDRTEKTIGTLRRMERYKGHLYNWYDTQTLAPLFPKYVSTVDSGNLVASLLLLKEEMLALPHRKMQRKKLLNGLCDTFYVLLDQLNEKEAALLQPFGANLQAACKTELMTHQQLESLTEQLAQQFASLSTTFANQPGEESHRWKQLLAGQLQHIKEELQVFLPWELLASAPQELRNHIPFPENASIVDFLQTSRELKAAIENFYADKTEPKEEWLQKLHESLDASIDRLDVQVSLLENLALWCSDLSDLEWDFLYDRQRNLFSIGYNVLENHPDVSHYDLLASEARLCAFIGIAQGKLPEESWFALGRLLTNVNGNTILLSWSGSMFEYLMPQLIMPVYENTLLGQTCKAAVDVQMDFGKQMGLPWGISESGYNMVNANSDYQYRAFGAPGLGLKRGLEKDAVVAPYASALALMIAPEKACENLELLRQKGTFGKFGFYEAIDYTPSRLPRGQSAAIVYSYMAHHQGMSLLAYAWLLLNQPMQKLFEAEPQFKAALLLLQERIPQISVFYRHTTELEDITYSTAGTETRVIKNPNTPVPQVQLLSNGRYNVMVSNSGAGYSRWKDLAVTRWREDCTSDNWGTFCYIRDLKSDTYWSTTYQPTLIKGDAYETVFSQGRVDFRMSKNDLEAHTTIVVSPEDDVELRRVVITNQSPVRRIIEVTSYAEVVLATQASDAMQPAFSNLFVQTELLSAQHAILCTRRPRSAEERPPWLVHLAVVHGQKNTTASYETDRMKFIGRGNTTANPEQMEREGLLPGSAGSVLDPIVAIRYRISLEPQEAVTMDMIIGVTETKDASLHLAEKFQDKHNLDRIFELAWTHSQVVLRQIEATEADAQLYGRLAASVIYANPLLRADPSILINNHRGQSGLWGYSVSGDLPIVLLKVESRQESMQIVRQLIQAHAYWRLKGLFVDLVIWNEEHNEYRRDFQDEIESLIPVELKDRPGGIFARITDHMSNEDRILFQTVARIIISASSGTLADHIKSKMPPRVVVPYLLPSKKVSLSAATLPLPQDLLFSNGLGGFSKSGQEYVIAITEKNRTPVPWVNVIANPNFGCVISESGSSYTWIDNAHELRLTPWSNDPVCDSSGEAFYLRDEETGHFWSPSFLPAGGQSTYVIRHGFGYSIFEYLEDGIYSEMKVFVDIHSPVKFTVLKIRNQSGRPRRLSATGYVEWVLGDSRMKNAMYVRTEVDPECGAIFAKNEYNTEFRSRVAFFDADYSKRSFTADRAEFKGRNGSLKNPDAMHRQKLSGRVGLALDPCAAIQVPFELAPGEEYEIVFRLGAGKDHHDAVELAKHFQGATIAHNAFEKAKNFWHHTTETLRVETPDTAINIIANGWLTYQTLSSRLWGRSGFYQSGGAFGFRDQLQDVMSLLFAAPELARDQILLSASRQFVEGDVQHWWHPPFGRGVRTHCSDDYLWLPFAVAVYISHTGNAAILDEKIPFLTGRPLNPGEESYYDLPMLSTESASLYDHCVLAIRHGFRFGEHGLPLIGSGDWNDGYDKVGEKGKGESVWLAFFLYLVLTRFEKIAQQRQDAAFAKECGTQALHLRTAIQQQAWDGEWYIRAWFDDGTPLGSSTDEEGKIDSIAQSWAVLSGAGDPARIPSAMEAAYTHLVDKEKQVIKLLHPPFDHSALNPGYIKGYVPGVRENGGQYTHAAVWLIMAYAKMKMPARVWELLRMINPLNHTDSPKAIETYKVEPYVLAADVYAVAPHTGRGGWTWYTGSAGWLYRLIIEYFLGLRQEEGMLRFAPCIPSGWNSFKMHYRFRKAVYHITVTQKSGNEEMQVMLDGVLREDKMIPLSDDTAEHTVDVIIFCGE